MPEQGRDGSVALAHDGPGSADDRTPARELLDRWCAADPVIEQVPASARRVCAAVLDGTDPRPTVADLGRAAGGLLTASELVTAVRTLAVVAVLDDDLADALVEVALAARHRQEVSLDLKAMVHDPLSGQDSLAGFVVRLQDRLATGHRAFVVTVRSAAGGDVWGRLRSAMDAGRLRELVPTALALTALPDGTLLVVLPDRASARHCRRMAGALLDRPAAVHEAVPDRPGRPGPDELSWWLAGILGTTD
ncbi:hypothetical protein GIS00_10340 [Nakamurella sp. YIM 132087]|uniref:Uncharacterized protein n=1 Tax=Nakamurella alba TaxID=2665158 RepID=A0A7K1FJN3_9ACTN|nr:hypothetical protein [Nakamurella alba]MTD14347.1 hypothetical protein [Nakamurella alba]